MYPRCFHPLYSEGLYADLEYCVDCQRTLDTARNTYAHLGGFLFPAVFTLWRNKASRYLVVPVSLGFALTFSTGGFLHSLQVAKVWNKIYGLDVRDLFDYFETGAVVIAAGMFLYKVYVYYHNYRRREQLLVDRPVMLFLLVYSGFFWLIMFRWVYVPFSLEKNIITLLAMSAYLISLVVFYQMRKNAVATGVTGQSS